MRIKVLFECLKLQNQQRYLEYVRNYNYREALDKSPLIKRDKFDKNEELSETSIDNIISQNPSE